MSKPKSLLFLSSSSSEADTEPAATYDISDIETSLQQMDDDTPDPGHPSDTTNTAHPTDTQESKPSPTGDDDVDDNTEPESMETTSLLPHSSSSSSSSSSSPSKSTIDPTVDPDTDPTIDPPTDPINTNPSTSEVTSSGEGKSEDSNENKCDLNKDEEDEEECENGDDREALLKTVEGNDDENRSPIV